MTEGNSDWIDKGKEILNMYKIDGMGKIISVFHNATIAYGPIIFIHQCA